MAGKVYTDPAQWAAAVRRYEQRLKDKPMISAIYRGLAPALEKARAQFRSEGIGRSIFGSKPGGEKKIVTIMGPRRVGQTFVAGLRLRGLAAIQDQGLRTKDSKRGTGKAGAHVPDRGEVFAIPTGGKFAAPGGTMFAARFKHKGAQHPRMPFGRAALESSLPGLRAAIEQMALAEAQKVIG